MKFVQVKWQYWFSRKPENRNMFKKLTLASILAVFILCGSEFSGEVQAAAGVYEQINFQGKLVNTDGTNVSNGTYTIDFTLYSASSGGSNLWTESQSVTVTDGLFRVSLGSATPFGSTVFDNDNLFLSVVVNGGSELLPRIRFAASPYAMNAKKVNGLNVTNTNGTLTIPSGATFALSGANSVTLTSSGTTTLTLPTTGTLATLAGAETLTNKTIGSTGLTFSGATTDIDTAAAEGLVIQGRAASTFQTTAGAITLQSAGAGTISTVQIGAGGSGSTTPDYLGLDVKSTTGDPAGGAEGYMYYNTFDNKFRCYQDAAWTDCIGSGSSGTITAVGDVLTGAAFTATAGNDGTSLYFEGTTADSNEVQLTSADPLTDITLTLPGAISGTILINELSDNIANALDIEQGSDDYLNISTQNGTEAINFGNTTTNPDYNFLGTSLTTMGGSLDVTGHIAVGSSATIDPAGSKRLINIVETVTDLSNGAMGTYVDLTLNPSGLPVDSYGNFSSLTVTTGNTQDFTSTYLGGSEFNIYYGATTQLASVTGLIGRIFNEGSGGISNAEGLSGYIGNNSSGTIANAVGIISAVALGSTGNITDAKGIFVSSNTDGGAGTITNNYGIQVGGQTAGTNDYGVRIDTADTQTLWLSGDADNTTAAAGIAFGSSRDTNLYRSAANTLQTDDSFVVSGGNIVITNQGDIQLRESGGANYFGLQAAGAMDSDDIYTWPSDMPTSNGYVLSSTTTGALSWIAAGGGSVTVRESDASPSVGTVSTIEFGPASTSSDEFIVTDQTGGVVRIRTGNKVVLTDASQTLTNKIIGSTGLTFTGATTDITTGTDEALTFSPNGTGDTIISTDADTNLQITASAAPGVDMVSLTNTGQGTVTTGVDGFSIAFTQGDDADATDTNAGLNVSVTNSSTDADILYGITIGAITGGAATEYALNIGAGWDRGLSVASASNFSAAVTNTSTLNNEGTTVIGSAGNTFTFNPASGPVYAGTARPTKTISLNPEYPGAVLSAFYGAGTDTNLNGAMTSDTDTSGNLLRNFYQWSSSQGSLNYYTVAVRVRLPKDFSAWATSNAIQIDYSTQSTSAANNLVDVRIYNGDDTPGTAVTSSTSNVSSVASTWTTVTIDDSAIDDGGAPDWDAADESAVIYIRMGSLSNNVVKIGDIRLNYLSAF